MWLPGQWNHEGVSLSRKITDNYNVLNCLMGFSLTHSTKFVIIMLESSINRRDM